MRNTNFIEMGKKELCRDEIKLDKSLKLRMKDCIRIRMKERNTGDYSIIQEFHIPETNGETVLNEVKTRLSKEKMEELKKHLEPVSTFMSQI